MIPGDVSVCQVVNDLWNVHEHENDFVLSTHVVCVAQVPVSDEKTIFKKAQSVSVCVYASSTCAARDIEMIMWIVLVDAKKQISLYGRRQNIKCSVYCGKVYEQMERDDTLDAYVCAPCSSLTAHEWNIIISRILMGKKNSYDTSVSYNQTIFGL